MIENAIKKLFERGERKVVIPGTGVILKRETSEMLFSDMLRHDDGRLAACIAELNGIPKEQAVALLAAYADGIASNLANNGSATIRGIGTIIRQADGTYQMVAEAEVPEVQAVAESVSVPEPEPQLPPVTAPQSMCGPDPDLQHRPEAEPIPQATDSNTEQNFIKPTEDTKINKAKLRAALYGDEPEDEEEAPTLATTTVRTASTTTTSAESIVTPAATFFGSTSTTEQPASDCPTAQPSDNATPQRPEIHIRRPGRTKRKPDVVMIAAIVALLIGLGVLLYGYVTKNRLDIEDNYIETSINTDATEISSES